MHVSHPVHVAAISLQLYIINYCVGVVKSLYLLYSYVIGLLSVAFCNHTSSCFTSCVVALLSLQLVPIVCGRSPSYCILIIGHQLQEVCESHRTCNFNCYSVCISVTRYLLTCGNRNITSHTHPPTHTHTQDSLIKCSTLQLSICVSGCQSG